VADNLSRHVKTLHYKTSISRIKSNNATNGLIGKDFAMGTFYTSNMTIFQYANTLHSYQESKDNIYSNHSYIHYLVCWLVSFQFPGQKTS